MKVANDTVVRFDYVLEDRKGEVLDSSEGHGPLCYLHGHGQEELGHGHAHGPGGAH